MLSLGLGQNDGEWGGGRDRPSVWVKSPGVRGVGGKWAGGGAVGLVPERVRRRNRPTPSDHRPPVGRRTTRTINDGEGKRK